jgi:DNA (cytosine-5)-methyltransferase 1
MTARPTFYEFFAGGGMARAGLGEAWECLFANDIDAKKGQSYAANWAANGTADQLRIEDVGRLKTTDLPGHADLVWASFPCQDLSLAGDYAGLKGERSGAFWPFWRLIEALGGEERAPSIVVLENVCGALTSHGGRDFASLASALVGAGYRFGAMVIDAVQFAPQSRPRLFLIGIHRDREIAHEPVGSGPDASWHPASIVKAHANLPGEAKDAWIWWRLPTPPRQPIRLSDLIEAEPQGVRWHSEHQTQRLLALMNPLHLEKVEQAKQSGRRMIGSVYKRTRVGVDGHRAQRAEVRFDDIAGCLRTPAGGSSRQTILIVDGDQTRSRLLSPREAARLMGLPESYRLPERYNDAYHLVGDGVVVPVVRFLAQHLLEPLIAGFRSKDEQAA